MFLAYSSVYISKITVLPFEIGKDKSDNINPYPIVPMLPEKYKLNI